MKTRCLTLPVVALLAAVTSTVALSQNPSSTEQLTGDYVALQGTWIVTHNEIAKMVTPEMHGRQFIFEGNQFHLDGDSGTERFAIDETTTPKRIDFMDDSSVIKGIYRLQDGILTLCTAPPGTERPTRFETARDSRMILTIVKRRLAIAEDPVAARSALTPAQVDHIIALTQANFWGKAKGLDGKLLSPADEQEKQRLLVPGAEATRVVNEAHKYGLALWCGLDWRPTYLEYMQAERAKGWNEKQIAFVGMLFGLTQGKVLRWLEVKTCTSEDESAIQQALDAERTRLSSMMKR